MVMYRKDLMEKAGLTMPEKPTWEFIKQAADKMTDKAGGVYGICLRGKPGWGENMAFLTATANSFGARWFDEKWNPQFNSPEWKATLDYYVPLMKADGPPGASSNGFNENLALFNDGKCGMWIDATVAASMVTDPKQSKVADKVGFALAPDNGLGKRGNWLWAWSLAVPAGTQQGRTRRRSSSPGRPASTTPISSPRRKAGRQRSAGHAHVALQERGIPEGGAVRANRRSTRSTRPIRLHPTVKPVPYTGVQFVAIPEFQGIATDVGQDFSAALAGTMTVDDALAKAQATTETAMKKAGYIK